MLPSVYPPLHLEIPEDWRSMECTLFTTDESKMKFSEVGRRQLLFGGSSRCPGRFEEPEDFKCHHSGPRVVVVSLVTQASALRGNLLANVSAFGQSNAESLIDFTLR